MYTVHCTYLMYHVKCTLYIYWVSQVCSGSITCKISSTNDERISMFYKYKLMVIGYIVTGTDDYTVTGTDGYLTHRYGRKRRRRGTVKCLTNLTMWYQYRQLLYRNYGKSTRNSTWSVLWSRDSHISVTWQLHITYSGHGSYISVILTAYYSKH